MSNVSIDNTWREIEWWQDDTNKADQKVRWRLIARCEENTNGNYSDVYFWVQKRITNGAQGWAEYPASKSMHVTCTGAASDTHSANMTWSFGRTTSTAWIDADGDYSDAYWSRVKHNADGTATIRAYITGDRVTSSSAIDTYVDLVLPTIPRASTPTTNKDTVVLNGTDSITITTNRASSNFTHTLSFTVGSNTVNVTNVGATYTWTPAVADWMPYMTVWKETVTLKCTTFNGTTQLGTSQITFKIQVNTTVYHPSIESITPSESNPLTEELETEGTFIKGYSSISLEIQTEMSSSDYNYALGSGKTVYNGITSTAALSGQQATFTKNIGTASASSATVKVADNKGYEVSQNYALTIIPYENIKVISVTLERVNGSVDPPQPSETGTTVAYQITFSAYSGSFGQVLNEIELYSLATNVGTHVYVETLEGTLDTEDATTQTYPNAVATYTISGKLSGTYSSSSQYTIQLKLKDKLSMSTSAVQRVNEGVPLFAWGSPPNGTPHFDVYGDFHIHDREDVTKFITLNMDTVETVPVTFSGANGGTVNWTVFKYGKFRLAVCKWKSTVNATIDGTWSGIYYSNDLNSPNYPVTFSDVLYTNVKYLAADAASHAELWDGGRTSVSNTSFGQFYLTRPNDGGAVTVNHPIFVEIVIGVIS